MDEPDTFPRIDPKDLDYTLIEETTRGVVFADVDLRAEIQQALIVDLLEGRCSYEGLRFRAKQFLARHFKNSNSKWGNLSLNEALSDGGVSLTDQAAWQMWSKT